MRYIIILVLLTLATIAKSQPPHNFLTTIGGSGEDIGYSAKQTLDGQYIIVGSTSSFGNGNTDVYLVKIDSMGNGLWEKSYGGIGNDVGKSIIQLADSGYVITGFTNSYGAGGYDAFLVRVDKNGNQIWQQTFGGLDWDFAMDLVLASDGNLFVVGYTSSFGNGKKDGFVLKYDLSGSLLLQKFIGGPENDDLKSIIATNDNFLATVGYTESKGEINGDCYFLKLDLNADTIFTKTFGGPYKDYASDLVQKNSIENYEYYIGGAKTYSSITSKTHAYMYRMSSTGVFLSDGDQFRNAEDENFISVANSNHKSYLTAFARSAIANGMGMQSEIYVAYINGFNYGVNDSGEGGSEYAYSVEATKDMGYIIVGSTNGYGSIGNDVFFIKRDSSIINYSSIVGVPKESMEKDFDVMFQKDLIYLKFSNAEENYIEIVDLMGKKIMSSVLTERENKIDISDYNSSIYVLKITFSNGEVYHSKFVVR